MTSQATVQALFGFNQAMNERLWTIIMEHLTDAQFVETDGYSLGSIRNQLVHMANAQRYWLRALLNIGIIAPKSSARCTVLVRPRLSRILPSIWRTSRRCRSRI